MSNVISINVYLDRRDKFPTPLTERQEAIQRGIVQWSILNQRLMEKATRRRPRRPRRR